MTCLRKIIWYNKMQQNKHTLTAPFEEINKI